MKKRACVATVFAIALAFSPSALVPAVAVGTEVGGNVMSNERFLVVNNHQDVHLQLIDGYPLVRMRDDGSISGSSSAFRASGTVLVAVPSQAEVEPSRISAQLGLDLPSPVWNLPEVQVDSLPWVGFSTLGVMPENLTQSDYVSLMVKSVESPADGRIVLWKQAGLDSDGTVLLDSDDLKKEWQFPLNSHVHSGILFTQPGRYDVVFSYVGEYHGVNCEDSTPADFSMTFLVGAEAIEQARADFSIREQTDPVDSEALDFKKDFQRPADPTSCDPGRPSERRKPQEKASDISAKPINDALKGLDPKLHKLNQAADEVIKAKPVSPGSSVAALSSTPNDNTDPVPHSNAQPTSVAPVASPVSIPASEPRVVSGNMPTLRASQASRAPAQAGKRNAAKPAQPKAEISDAPKVAVEQLPAAAAGASLPAMEPDVTTVAVSKSMGMGEGFALGIGLMSLLMGMIAFAVARRITSTD
ncbi:MAG: choice-of-anchor M domain-containing protein [Corynebacterium sp.]|uniref:choice-of-anchor M domain-containing protein n=1 Tax=Corynebacterium sp. TaxID=1720 RepID=UPI0026DC77DC|nr:choice-of-anchor M domain-containing protein [Corynebacterium sp.]MDO4760978.1 choice-of-anchor M domain-containing protein [Corynebacterium sp.]